MKIIPNEGLLNQRSLIAENARVALQTVQRIYGARYQRDAINVLIESFKRIESDRTMTSTEALQDHFDAMTAIALDSESLRLLQVETPALFRNCESMLRHLVKNEGAAFKVVQ